MSNRKNIYKKRPITEIFDARSYFQVCAELYARKLNLTLNEAVQRLELHFEYGISMGLNGQELCQMTMSLAEQERLRLERMHY